MPDREFNLLDFARMFGSADEAHDFQQNMAHDGLCQTSRIPRKMRGISQEDLEALGFKFLDGGDDLFQDVQLPQGWRLQRTDHPLWSEVATATGVGVFSVFYKAGIMGSLGAEAFMRGNPRWKVETLALGFDGQLQMDKCPDENDRVAMVVYDRLVGERHIVKRSEPAVPREPTREAYRELRDALDLWADLSVAKLLGIKEETDEETVEALRKATWKDQWAILFPGG